MHHADQEGHACISFCAPVVLATMSLRCMEVFQTNAELLNLGAWGASIFLEIHLYPHYISDGFYVVRARRSAAQHRISLYPN